MTPPEATPGARRRRFPWLPVLLLVMAALGLVGWLAVSLYCPYCDAVARLPQRVYYDFVANRGVTERLVDPALLKVEQWQILAEEREVLFVHPAPSGSVALVFPVKIEPGTTFRAELAMAPEAWSLEGDGVVFALYVEDETGMHLIHSRYVDPKHHQQDQRWIPMRVNLRRFGGELVRVILVVGSGPAGDRRYDWAGWGAPRLEQPTWPWLAGRERAGRAAP